MTHHNPVTSASERELFLTSLRKPRCLTLSSAAGSGAGAVVVTAELLKDFCCSSTGFLGPPPQNFLHDEVCGGSLGTDYSEVTGCLKQQKFMLL